YLLPLGHADFIHSGRLWLGLIFVLFPLGLLLYGVNDLADAEADQLNPRKGTYMFGSRGGREQLAALRWQIVAAQLPFLAAFYCRDWMVTGFLALGAVWFVLDATLLWQNRSYRPKEMRLFLWGWNIAAALGIFWNWAQGTLIHLNSSRGL